MIYREMTDELWMQELDRFVRCRIAMETLGQIDGDIPRDEVDRLILAYKAAPLTPWKSKEKRRPKAKSKPLPSGKKPTNFHNKKWRKSITEAVEKKRKLGLTWADIVDEINGTLPSIIEGKTRHMDWVEIRDIARKYRDYERRAEIEREDNS